MTQKYGLLDEALCALCVNSHLISNLMQARHYAHFKGEDKGSGPRCRLRPQSRWKMKVFAVVFTTETKACRVLLTESLLLAFPAFGNLEINRNGR